MKTRFSVIFTFILSIRAQQQWRHWFDGGMARLVNRFPAADVKGVYTQQAQEIQERVSSPSQLDQMVFVGIDGNFPRAVCLSSTIGRSFGVPEITPGWEIVHHRPSLPRIMPFDIYEADRVAKAAGFGEDYEFVIYQGFAYTFVNSTDPTNGWDVSLTTRQVTPMRGDGLRLPLPDDALRLSAVD